jgi:hypothetical protein
MAGKGKEVPVKGGKAPAGGKGGKAPAGGKGGKGGK